MLKVFSIFLAIFLFASSQAYAGDTFITVSNPVRGPEGWQATSQSPLELPKFQYDVATSSAIPVAWMLRYDAVKDSTISAFFKTIYETDNTQSLGAFLEITPSLAQAANVQYPDGISIFNANRIFLSGYYPDQRIKIIDTYMSAFKERFGFLPRSVGAWHIDSFSLDYLHKKYSVLVALICDDQYSTDGYRLWGGYLGSPYLPSKKNILVPAQSAQDRLDVVVIRWAQRDLFNFYGAGGESIYSVQVNDYLLAKQNTEYFEEILKQYGQKGFNEISHINLGLENDYSKPLYSKELFNSFNKVNSLKRDLDINFVTLEALGNYVLNRYPETSPVYFYQVKDPLGKSDAVTYWYQNAYYRIGIKSENGQSKIIDFRSYNNKLPEDYLYTPNTDSKLYLELPAITDSVKYKNSEVQLEIDLSKPSIQYDHWRVTLESGGKIIKLKPQEIEFQNLQPSIQSEDIKVVNAKSSLIWKIVPHLPLTVEINHLYLLIAVFTPLILCSLLIKNYTLAIGLLMAGLTTLTVVRSGQLYPFGLGVWGPNGHDAIFHISLIEKFSQNPLNMSHPQISGEKLSNYHFAFDYLSGLFSRVSSIPADTVYFLVFPIVISLALVFLLRLLFKKWNLNQLESQIAYIFVFMAGSLGYIPAFLSGGNPIYSESVFWANQSSSILLNPPFAVSLVFLLIFFLLYEKFPKPNAKQLMLLALVGGLLSQTKIYAFILLCLALLLARKIKILLAVGIAGTLLTLPFSSVNGSPFDISPLWFARSLFASHDRVWWPRLSQAWATYESGGIWLKLIFVNLVAFGVFLIGNLSTRIFAIPYFFKTKVSTTQKLALFVSFSGVVLPSLIIQKINPWNTIQFMYYSLFFLGIFAAREIARVSKSIKSGLLRSGFLILIIGLTIYTGLGTIYSYLGFYSSSRISYTELYALEKLRSMPKGVVLSPLFNEQVARLTPTPKPLYSYVSTAYISAYSHQPEYLSDTINLDITNFDYTERSRKVQRFYQTDNRVWLLDFLNSEDITYVYETPLSKIKVSPNSICLEKIFDSGEINIYKFNCHVQN